MSNKLTQSEKDALSTFPPVAQGFCTFVEGFADYELEVFVLELSIQLARVCEAAAKLPYIVAESRSESELEIGKPTSDSVAAHTERWRELRLKLQTYLGNADHYWKVFDPTTEKDPVEGMLSDDIADIYLDLQDGLNLLASGAPAGDAYFKWRFDFRAHWWRHAADALKTTLAISDLALPENFEQDHASGNGNVE